MGFFCRFSPANLFVLLRVFKLETYFQRKKTGRQFKCGMPIAECGLQKKTKKIRNPQSEMTEPMLFPRTPAKGGSSGPQACFFAEKAIAKVKWAKNL